MKQKIYLRLSCGFSDYSSLNLNAMLRKLSMLFASCGMIFILSCGTNKKLQEATAQIEQLKSQNAQLTTQNTQLTTDVNDLKNKMATLQSNSDALTAEYAKYKQGCEETQRKYHAVQAVIQDQYNTLQTLEKKIEDAEADFRDKGVEVYYKDGLVYVRMEDNLLYKSGSASLGPKGKQALGPLANVLNDYPRLKVIVLGNTDDKLFKKGTDNWSLSTERANGVVRCLRDDYKVDPTRLTSAGKGRYNPVADNSTNEGRAKNRRTDIILNPDIDRLWQESQQ